MSSINSKIFLHIGLHKTATTTLQKYFYPYCSGLNFLTNQIVEVNEFIESIVTSDPIYHDIDRATQLIKPHIAKEVPNLISREALSGSLYDGCIKYGLDHRSPIINNLKAVLPEAKIIIVIRRQDSLARAIYRQYLKEGGTESVKKFFGKHNFVSRISLNRFKYTRYIKELERAFPAGVLILTLEELSSNQEAFLQKLCDFIGIPLPNINLKKSNQSSLGSVGMEVSRLVNHFFYSRLNPGGIFRGIPKNIDDGKIVWTSISGVLHDRWPFRKPISKNSHHYKISKSILDTVKQDNKLLDQQYKLDLRKYGYY